MMTYIITVPHQCSRGRARIVVYDDGHLSADSAGSRIGIAALPRSFGSQSMTIRILVGAAGPERKAKVAKEAEAQAMHPWVRAVDGP
jgi:hypothetical protein